MDDEAKIVFELLDRSGAGGQAATNPVQPGSAEIPGSAVARDFADHITTEGAGAKAGTGSATPTPAPIEAPSTAPAESPVASDPGGVRINVPGGDALAPVIEQIIQNKPDITADELARVKELNLNREQAQQWIDRAKGNNQPTTPEDTGPDKDLKRFADTIIEKTLTDEERYQRQLGKLREAREAGLLNEEQYQRGRYEAGSRLPSPFAPDSSKGIIEAKIVSPPSISKAASELNHTLNSVGGLDRIGGMLGGNVGYTVGGLAQTALTSIPKLLPAGEATGPLAAIAANAGPIAAGAGLVAAAIAVPMAAGYAALNEAERALAISRQYSPDVARSQAEADVRQVMADLRTTRLLGDEAAAYLSGRSKLSTGLQGIRDVASEPVLKDVARLTNAVGNLVNALGTGANEGGIGSWFAQRGWDIAISNMLPGANTPGKMWFYRTLMDEFNKGIEKLLPGTKAKGPFDWFDDQDHLPLSKDSMFSESDISNQRPMNPHTNMPGLGF